MDRRQAVASGSNAPATPTKPMGPGQLRISPPEAALLAQDQQPSPLEEQAAAHQPRDAPPNLFPLLPVALSFLSALQQGSAASAQAQGLQPPQGAASGSGNGGDGANGSSGLSSGYGSLLSIAADAVYTRNVPFSPDP